jgi:hypothetical protein
MIIKMKKKILYEQITYDRLKQQLLEYIRKLINKGVSKNDVFFKLYIKLSIDYYFITNIGKENHIILSIEEAKERRYEEAFKLIHTFLEINCLTVAYMKFEREENDKIIFECIYSIKNILTYENIEVIKYNQFKLILENISDNILEIRLDTLNKKEAYKEWEKMILKRELLKGDIMFFDKMESENELEDYIPMQRMMLDSLNIISFDYFSVDITNGYHGLDTNNIYFKRNPTKEFTKYTVINIWYNYMIYNNYYYEGGKIKELKINESIHELEGKEYYLTGRKPLGEEKDLKYLKENFKEIIEFMSIILRQQFRDANLIKMYEHVEKGYKLLEKNVEYYLPLREEVEELKKQRDFYETRDGGFDTSKKGFYKKSDIVDMNFRSFNMNTMKDQLDLILDKKDSYSRNIK